MEAYTNTRERESEVKADFIFSQCWQENILDERFLEARQEDPFVVGSLYQGVGSVSILQ